MFCSVEEDVHVELEDVVHANIPYISMAIEGLGELPRRLPRRENF